MDVHARIQKIGGERIKHARTFFKTRELSFDCVLEAFKYQISDYRHLLLTSSPVHGIANKGSDIDIICVTDHDVPLPRMASQSFKGTDHFEIIAFSLQEVEETLDFLARVGELPPPDGVELLGQWKSRCPVSKKYIERIVNGVDITETAPYVEFLFTLGRVWQLQSFDSFRRFVILALLSERAGETRGRVGYALNCLQYLMDCIMSCHGYVFCNKKWYQFRFKLFIEQRNYSAEFAAVVEEIIGLHGILKREINGFQESLANRLLDLYAAAKNVFGYRFQEEPVLRSDGRSQCMPFLDHSSLYIDRFGAALLLGDSREEQRLPWSMRDIVSLSSNEAMILLNKVRADIVEIKIPTKTDETGGA